MATDRWPDEEGAIFDAGALIFPCYPEDTILEGSSVKLGTSADGRLTVAVSAALGDGVGVACRAGDTGVPSRIPILFYGFFKMKNATTVMTSGELVMNDVTTTVGKCWVNASDSAVALRRSYGGSSYILGMICQTTVLVNDEVLVLVGKTA